MIEASCSGRLNYKDSCSDSVVWLQREQLVLLAVERDLLIDFLKVRHAQIVSTCVWPEMDKKGEFYKHHFDDGLKILKEIGGAIMPYLKWDKKEYYTEEMKKMREEYTRIFGDPSSPEFKARVKKDEENRKRMEIDNKQKATREALLERERANKLARLKIDRYKRPG